MASKRRSNKRPLTGDEILKKGGLSQAEIEAGRRRTALRDVTVLTNVLTVVVTAGADVLQRDFGFTQTQAADWAEKTIQAARELLNHGTK